MWKLTKHQATVDATYNLERARWAEEKNFARNQLNRQKTSLNDSLKSKAQRERARTYDQLTRAGCGLYDLGSDKASRVMQIATQDDGDVRQRPPPASIRNKARQKPAEEDHDKTLAKGLMLFALI